MHTSVSGFRTGTSYGSQRTIASNNRIRLNKSARIVTWGCAGDCVAAQNRESARRLVVGRDTHTPALDGNADEEVLAQLLKARSVTAWETLFERHFERVCRYARGRLFSREAAEDVAAGTFDRALATIDGYSYQGRPILAWLYGIARNIVKETWRNDIRQQGAGMLLSLFIHSNGHRPDHVLPLMQVDGTDAAVSRIDLTHAIARLTEIQREVVLLRYFGGLSASETGQVIGRPETAVYALQARALAALRRQLTSANTISLAGP